VIQALARACISSLVNFRLNFLLGKLIQKT